MHYNVEHALIIHPEPHPHFSTHVAAVTAYLGRQIERVGRLKRHCHDDCGDESHRPGGDHSHASLDLKVWENGGRAVDA